MDFQWPSWGHCQWRQVVWSYHVWTYQGYSWQYLLFNIEFTKWEKINVKGPMTLQELKVHFETTYKIEVSMITYGSSTVFTSFDKGVKDRLPMKVPAAIEALTKKEIPKYKRFLALGVSGSTSDGIDCLLPDVRY